MAGGLIIYGIGCVIAPWIMCRAMPIRENSSRAIRRGRDFCGWVYEPAHNPLDDITDPDRAADAGRGR